MTQLHVGAASFTTMAYSAVAHLSALLAAISENKR